MFAAVIATHHAMQIPPGSYVKRPLQYPGNIVISTHGKRLPRVGSKTGEASQRFNLSLTVYGNMGATMTLQSGFKLLLASAVAVCGAATANAQSVVTEISGDVQSFHGGWTGNSSQIGQPVTFDFAYDASAVTTTDTSTKETDSAPITYAKLVGGVFGAGINLEPDGSGAGKLTDTLDFNSGITTIAAQTSTHAPSPGFSGDVYGFSLDFNGTSTSVDLTRDVYSHGHLDRDESGTVDLGNVGVGQVQAPEIDPTSALSALTLLMGGLAVIRGRQTVKLQSA
jgi:hypothetical protein